MQIQAYLDNVFDVGGLLEDAETKNVALEKVDELEEHLSHVRTIFTPFHYGYVIIIPHALSIHQLKSENLIAYITKNYAEQIVIINKVVF